MPTAIPDDFQESTAELAKLANLLSDPGLRKSFYNDPVNTAREAEVDVENPKINAILDTLSELSVEELRLLSLLNDREKWPLFVEVNPMPPTPLFVF